MRRKNESSPCLSFGTTAKTSADVEAALEFAYDDLARDNFDRD